MKIKFSWTIVFLGLFAILQATNAFCCGMGGVKKNKAVDPDDETAMSDVEHRTEVV